jgi:hypothetical protein
MQQFADAVLSKTKSVSIPVEGSHIYFLLREKAVVYVGKSNSLISRVGNHTRDKKFDEVSYLEVTKEDQDRLEIALIKAFKAEYNLQASSKITDADISMLRKYGFEDHILYSRIRAMPHPERGDYGAVFFELDGKIQAGYYDDDEFGDHLDECPAEIALEALGDELSEIVKDEINSKCDCPPDAIVYADGFRGYYTLPISQLYRVPENDEESGKLIKSLMKKISKDLGSKEVAYVLGIEWQDGEVEGGNDG